MCRYAWYSSVRTIPTTDRYAGKKERLRNLRQRLKVRFDGSHLDHQHPVLCFTSGLPSSKAGVRFLGLLGNDEKAFDDLYCIAFCMLDAQWLARHASYMEFNVIKYLLALRVCVGVCVY
ncbi:hypothetical protein GW17_00014264 [Ensete ventricosum]|nr:hypothetical protein GW17_00014264 [Ensete ventricosum]RZS03987.1 hypothetical protein BHM03_00034252 [Ensete ventricosum]